MLSMGENMQEIFRKYAGNIREIRGKYIRKSAENSWEILQKICRKIYKKYAGKCARKYANKRRKKNAKHMLKLCKSVKKICEI